MFEQGILVDREEEEPTAVPGDVRDKSKGGFVK